MPCLYCRSPFGGWHLSVELDDKLLVPTSKIVCVFGTGVAQNEWNHTDTSED